MSDESALWEWAVEVYGREGVAERSLWFQDERAANVPLMLFICWAVTQGVAPDRALLARARQITTLWHKEVVVPLRGLRGALKADSKGIPVELARRFRDEVKSLELEAERVELDTLGRLLEGPGSDDTDSSTQQNMMFEGLARYLDGLPASAGELDHDRITQLVAAVTG